MKSIHTVFAIGALLALAACSKADQSGAPAADPMGAAPAAPPILTVNGTAVSPEFFNFYVQNAAGKPAAELTPEERTRAIDSLARIYVLAQRAEKDGLTKDTDTANRLELARLSVIQQGAAQAFLKDKTPTEQEVRAEYETQIAQTPAQEYRARHILVQSEALAQRLIGQIKGGGNFNKLAGEFSIDTGSKANGGDLGWFSPNAMVPQFSAAVTALKKGEVTQAPVQTQFGFHVIKLEDMRDSTPPSFEQSREQVAQIVQRKKFQQHLDALLKEAKIDPPLAAATPATPAATPADGAAKPQ
jgi:peptidyl-prolyl cis-trans isomerase C